MKAIILGLATLPLFALAGDKIDEQIEVPLDGKVVIENQRGKVTIKSWDKPSFKVSGELDELADGYTLETQGNVTEFIVKMPRRNKGWNNKRDGSRLTIYMPKQSELDFEGVNVDVDVSNFSAGVAVTTVNGDIEVNQVNGKIELETVNGDIEGKELSGNIRYETVNGDIEDMASSGKLRFNAVNGGIESMTQASDIRVENVNGEVDFDIASLKDLRMSTVNGEINVKLRALEKRANIRFESVSGDVDFYFPTNLSARFDIDAHAGGRIINELSADKEKKAKYGPSRELEFVINDGDVDVEIDTVSGRIALKKL
ncbi:MULTISPECIES: DUF4097 family beta strand repeat-containing protein [unclassified Pseudoalteromonas]|uniref:DUF4097 family beta strand repeat-containing protein n=1 Tax=unclassified Pseudoalteromonas TaxID=194690 RepID=UPI0020976937|nr:DUF4097 family beta strand repeat-containing protein [Pseudoalteromonas sp. XMcav2-N]MCO7189808.1 DUF4097 family beta strand repeat-containing protein [Pseudoalteromonas sp. XMcav2-N]